METSDAAMDMQGLPALDERPACPCGGILAERVVWDGWGYTVRVICRSCWRGTRGVGPLLAEARRDAWHGWLAAREPGEE